MADISAFPTIDQPVKIPVLVRTFKAGATISAGQVVAIDATGVSNTVRPGIAESGEMPVGVAVHDASSGEYVAVCMIGVCTVANADDTTGIDAGDFLETNGNAVGGTVSAVNVSATGGATVTCHNAVIGIALEDIAGGSTGEAMIIPGITVVQPNSS